MVGTLKPAVQDLGQQVLPFLKRLTPQEVLSIWGHLSNHVLRQLSLHKGVQIPGFGTFTFRTQKTVMGKKKFIPVFIVDKKLIGHHGLKQDQMDIPGDIPVFPLDFDVISLETSFSKEWLKYCVKGTVHHLSRSISTRKRVIFHLTGIGVLTIEGTKVQMSFFEDLISVLDRTWAMEEAVTNRPGSMLSSPKTSGKPPRCPLIFPRTQLKESEKKTPIETLVADGQHENNGEEVVREKHIRRPLKLPVLILPRPMPDNAGGGNLVKPERHLTDRTAEQEQRKRMSQSLQEHRKNNILQKRQREKAFQRTSDRLFHLDQPDGYQLGNQCRRSTSKKGESSPASHNLLLRGSRLA